MVLGNYKFRNSDGFSFNKLVYLKFDRTLWEQNGISIINALLLIKKNTIKTNKFEAINSNGNKMDSVNFFDLKKINEYNQMIWCALPNSLNPLSERCTENPEIKKEKISFEYKNKKHLSYILNYNYFIISLLLHKLVRNF